VGFGETADLAHDGIRGWVNDADLAVVAVRDVDLEIVAASERGRPEEHEKRNSRTKRMLR